MRNLGMDELYQALQPSFNRLVIQNWREGDSPK